MVAEDSTCGHDVVDGDCVYDGSCTHFVADSYCKLDSTCGHEVADGYCKYDATCGDYVADGFCKLDSSCMIYHFDGFCLQDASCGYYDDISLKLNSTGDDVYALKQKLKSIGYTTLNDTDEFDVATDTAVREFQSITGLKVDGKVGDQTWIKLRGAVGLMNSGYTSRGMKSTAIEQLNQQLSSLGYDVNTTSAYDSKTESAVRLFQTLNPEYHQSPECMIQKQQPILQRL